ncbi:MAG: TolC family protein [Candidatus Latescibacterota bacterium]
MSRMPLSACAALLVALAYLPGHAAEPMLLGLEEAVRLALANNLELHSAALDTLVQAESVAAEGSRFGRTLVGRASHLAQRTPSVSALEQVQTTSSDRQSLALGLSQQLPTGGSAALSLVSGRSASNVAFRTMNPIYDSALELSLTQPLLQGVGRINRVGLELAQNGLAQAGLRAAGQARDLHAEVALAYWDLFAAQHELAVKEQLQAGALRVLETVRARLETGTGTRSSVLVAEVSVAQRDEEIVVAGGAVQAAEDRLEALCGLDRQAQSRALSLAPADTPRVVPFTADLEEGVSQAVATSVPLQQARLQVESLGLQVDLARDQSRPAADLNVTLGLTGIGGRYGDDLSVLRQGEARSWGGGANLSVPFGPTSAEARYRQRRLEQERREVDLEDLRLQVAQQARQRHRQVGISLRRIDAVRAAVGLAQLSVEEQEARLGLGLSTAREVLDAQDALATARLRLLRAHVDYSQALALWDQITGG